MKLEQLVKDNEDAILALAQKVLPSLIDGLDSVAGFVAFVTRRFGDLISTFRFVRAILAVVQFQIVRFVNFLRRIPANIKAVTDNAATLFRAFSAAVTGNFKEAGRILREEVKLDELGMDLNALAAETAVAEQQAQELVDAFERGTPVIDAAADGIQKVGAAFRSSAAGADAAREANEKATAATKKNTQANLDNIAILNKRTAAQTKNLAAFEKIIRAENLLREGGPTAAEKEIAAITEQLILLEKRAAFKDDEGKKEQAIVALSIRRAEIATRIRNAEANLPEILAGVNAQIEALSTVDPMAATDFAVQLQNALSEAGGDPEAATLAAANISQAILEETSVISPTIGANVATAIKGAFTGEGPGIAATLGELLQMRSQEGLTTAFDEAVDFFGGKLDDVLKSAGGFIGGLLGDEGALGGIGTFFDEKLGKGGGELFGKAATGILGAGLTAFAQRNAEDSASQVAAGVTSAVTSTQAVRGIVAGPTQIAVAQVDRAISDAFIETNRILGRIEENTRSTAVSTSDTGTGSVPVGGTDESIQALANEGPSLA